MSIVTLKIEWRGEDYIFEKVDPNRASIAAIKAIMHERTGVAPCDQQLLGLTLKTASGHTYVYHSDFDSHGMIVLTMSGTPLIELLIAKIESIKCLKHTEEEYMRVYSAHHQHDMNHPPTRAWKFLLDFGARVDLQFLNKPRSNKKLLILDLDHTILHFDSKDEGQSHVKGEVEHHNLYNAKHSADYCNTMKRPHMDHFLASVYEHYDIAVWSQTHWRWIEIKMSELGMLSNDRYKISFIMDKSCMLKIPPVGYVKPLHIIWQRSKGVWGQHNTIHVDDLDRNFVLNKRSGLVVTPFYRKGFVNIREDSEPTPMTLPITQYGSEGGDVDLNDNSVHSAVVKEKTPEDVELFYLAQYLCSIADSSDLSACDHSLWRKKVTNMHTLSSSTSPCVDLNDFRTDVPNIPVILTGESEGEAIQRETRSDSLKSDFMTAVMEAVSSATNECVQSDLGSEYNAGPPPVAIPVTYTDPKTLLMERDLPDMPNGSLSLESPLDAVGLRIRATGTADTTNPLVLGPVKSPSGRRFSGGSPGGHIGSPPQRRRSYGCQLTSPDVSQFAEMMLSPAKLVKPKTVSARLRSVSVDQEGDHEVGIRSVSEEVKSHTHIECGSTTPRSLSADAPQNSKILPVSTIIPLKRAKSTGGFEDLSVVVLPSVKGTTSSPKSLFQNSAANSSIPSGNLSVSASAQSLKKVEVK